MRRLLLCLTALMLCLPARAEGAVERAFTPYISAVPMGGGGTGTMYVTYGVQGGSGECAFTVWKLLDGAVLSAKTLTAEPDDHGMVTLMDSMSVPDAADQAHIYSFCFDVTDEAGRSACGKAAGMWVTDYYLGSVAHRAFELASAVSSGADALEAHTRHSPAFDAGDLIPAMGDADGCRPGVTCLLCGAALLPAAVICADKCIVLPAGMKSIEAEALAGLGDVQQIWLPDGAESVGSGAFAGCGGLLLVRIPGSVTQIDAGAFDGAERFIVMCPEDSTAWQYCEDCGLVHVTE